MKTIRQTIKAVAFCATVGSAAVGSAANFWDWTGEAGDGLWSTPGNWSEGTHSVPANGARFISQVGPYTIDLDEPCTVGDFRVSTQTTDETAMAQPVLVGGELNVTRHFAVGVSHYDIGYNKYGASSYPTWRNASSASLCVMGSTIKIGSPEKRGGFFAVGSGVTLQAGTSYGTFSMTGGVFQAYVDNAYVGYMAQNNNSTKGIVHLEATPNGLIDAKNSLWVGGTYASWRTAELSLGTNWTVRVGSKEAAASSLCLAATISSYADASCNSKMSMDGGTFEAYVSKVRMSSPGSNRPKFDSTLSLRGLNKVVIEATDSVSLAVFTGGNYTEGMKVNAELDASTSSNITFNTPLLQMGMLLRNCGSRNGHGILRLGRGAGTVGSLTLNNIDYSASAMSHIYGIIDLKGFQMTLTNEVKVAGCGIVSNDVNGVSSGFALNETATLAQSDGKMYVTFSRDPEGLFKPVSQARAEDCYWGFKWAGDHVSDVQALIDAGKLVVDTTGLSAKFLAKYALYYSAKDDTTYLGVPVVPVGSGMKVLFR